MGRHTQHAPGGARTSRSSATRSTCHTRFGADPMSQERAAAFALTTRTILFSIDPASGLVHAAREDRERGPRVLALEPDPAREGRDVDQGAGLARSVTVSSRPSRFLHRRPAACRARSPPRGAIGLDAASMPAALTRVPYESPDESCAARHPRIRRTSRSRGSFAIGRGGRSCSRRAACRAPRLGSCRHGVHAPHDHRSEGVAPDRGQPTSPSAGGPGPPCPTPDASVPSASSWRPGRPGARGRRRGVRPPAR